MVTLSDFYKFKLVSYENRNYWIRTDECDELIRMTRFHVHYGVNQIYCNISLDFCEQHLLIPDMDIPDLFILFNVNQN